MKEILDIFQATKDATFRNANMDFSERLIKLFEEGGEISAAHLKLTGKKPMKGESHMEVEDNLKEECADALMVIYSMIHVLGITESELQYIISIKLAKWDNAVKELAKRL